MKRFLIMTMIVILSTTQAFAVGVSIDGNAVKFTADSGEPFVDSNNRTMVPLRVTMEAAGATVEWDAAARVAGVSKNGVIVNVPIGQKHIIKNGRQIENDTAAVIIDGRTYLPIRAVLEAHGFSVDWDGGSQTVLVTAAPIDGSGTSPITPMDNLTDNPTAEQVKAAIVNIADISIIEIVTEDRDPNGNLGKQGGYTGCLFFKSPLVNETDLYLDDGESISSAIDCGTAGGGSIEIYATANDANRRNEYLAGFDGGLMASGSHTVLGTLVIRISDELKASQQKSIETAIVNVLSGKGDQK